MKTNVKKPTSPVARTAGGEGAIAAKITPEQELRRICATALLWEDSAYESGKSLADRVAELIPQCKPEFVAAVAFEARTQMKLRHMPLFIAREMARGPVPHRLLVAKLLPDIIQRADELSEFLAIYWKDDIVAGKKSPISAQVKKGLAAAFNKFNEYALAKYNRDGAVKLRDVAFLTHPNPKDADLMARLVNKDKIPTHTKGGHEIDLPVGKRVSYGTPADGFYSNPGLDTPDTWEVELSAGKTDKKTAWTRLLAENKLGALAFIRNLRNMTEAGVDRDLITAYAKTVNTERVLPFRFITAARENKPLEDILEPLMLRAAGERPKLLGKTVVVIDTSGSMGASISTKSTVSRLKTAAALAILLREQCDDVRFYATAGSDGGRTHATMAIAPRRGFALADEFETSKLYPKIGGGGIFLKQMCDWVADKEKTAERLIVLTDEQDVDNKANPKEANAFGVKNYIINVASHKNGVGYGKWHHIDGWSESVLDYIQYFETLQ